MKVRFAVSRFSSALRSVLKPDEWFSHLIGNETANQTGDLTGAF